MKALQVNSAQIAEAFKKVYGAEASVEIKGRKVWVDGDTFKLVDQTPAFLMFECDNASPITVAV